MERDNAVLYTVESAPGHSTYVLGRFTVTDTRLWQGEEGTRGAIFTAALSLFSYPVDYSRVYTSLGRLQGAG